MPKTITKNPKKTIIKNNNENYEKLDLYTSRPQMSSVQWSGIMPQGENSTPLNFFFNGHNIFNCVELFSELTEILELL